MSEKRKAFLLNKKRKKRFYASPWDRLADCIVKAAMAIRG